MRAPYSVLPTCLAALLAACVEDPVGPVLEPPSYATIAAAGTKYYVDAVNGKDSNNGLSPGKAWKTLNKVSREWGRRRFVGGDSVFFTGTFTGGLDIGSASVGSTAAPIVLVGPATIRPGNAQKGIQAIDVAGVEIKSLHIVGAGRLVHTTECVLAYFATGGTHAVLRLRSMQVSGCGSHAVWIGSYAGSTLTDVLIDGLDVSGSLNGIAIQGDRRGAIQRVTIRNTDARDNPGRRGHPYGSGNGIQIGQVVDGLIERSRAWNNGAENDNPSSGPVGIWTWESTRVTIRYNQSYANRTALVDGAGFDLDGGSQDCVLEFNYSHDNMGSGYLGYQYAGAAAWLRNTIRYNISERDGMGLDEGGSIRLGSGAGTSLGSGWVTANTVFTDNSGAYRGSALYLRASVTTGLKIQNNILFATNGARLIRNLGSTSIVVRGNNYWTAGGAWEILWGGAIYRSLTAFRSGATKEYNAGTDIDPQLVSPGGGGTLAGRTVGTAPSAYKLTLTSTMPGAGIDLSKAGALLPVTDYYGSVLPLAAVLGVGASITRQ
jgi:hypothetical protein